MKQVFDEFRLYRSENPGEPFQQTDQAVLRWSNPIRNFFSDGATFLWLDGKRPVAAATISVRGTGEVWREFVSLSNQTLRCVRQGRMVWTPQSRNLLPQPLPDSPAPASSPKLRLAQIRQLARRFTVIMSESQKQLDKGKMLRLLPQPVYRWSEEDAGVIDGASFAFCETTDPEAFLMLELIRLTGQAKPVWRFSLARMTSRPLVFRLDDREVLSLKHYWANPRSPNDPYAERHMRIKYRAPTDTDTSSRRSKP